jgi:hypothetical protein
VNLATLACVGARATGFPARSTSRPRSAIYRAKSKPIGGASIGFRRVALPSTRGARAAWHANWAWHLDATRAATGRHGPACRFRSAVPTCSPMAWLASTARRHRQLLGAERMNDSPPTGVTDIVAAAPALDPDLPVGRPLLPDRATRQRCSQSRKAIAARCPRLRCRAIAGALRAAEPAELRFPLGIAREPPRPAGLAAAPRNRCGNCCDRNHAPAALWCYTTAPR